MKTLLTKRGFTLIELLLVIGIIAILAAIVIVAINPTKQLADARNAQRRSDVNTILNAYWQYAIDHSGSFYPTSVDGAAMETGCTIESTAKNVCKVTTPHGTDAGDCGDSGNECVWSRHLSGTYVTSVPADPQDTETGAVEPLRVDYKIATAGAGRITVTAPSAEQGASISVTR